MLPADVSRCIGGHCSVREHCLRHTIPAVPDHPNQSWIESPHTEDVEVECGLFMFDLKPEARAKFFHPGTFGTMEWATVVAVISNAAVMVRFDKPHPDNNRRTFEVPANHVEAGLGRLIQQYNLEEENSDGSAESVSS